jgi:hypothetical protein
LASSELEDDLPRRALGSTPSLLKLEQQSVSKSEQPVAATPTPPVVLLERLAFDPLLLRAEVAAQRSAHDR